MKERMRKVFLSIAVAFCAIFAVFGIALTAQGVSEDAAADVKVPIKWADVEEFTAPEIGALPDMAVTPVHGGYEVAEIFWMYKTGNYFSEWNTKKPFAAGNTYRVGITLKPDDGFFYDKDFDHYVAINGETVQYNVVDEWIVLIKDFTLDSYVTSVSILNFMDPVAGKLPDMSADCANDSYTSTVRWVNRSTLAAQGSDQQFEAGQCYTAYITLTAKDGYIFKPELNVYINGARVNTVGVISEKVIEVEMHYLELERAPLQDVKVKLEKPMPGATPDFNAESSGEGFVADYDEEGYINGVRWIDRVTGIMLTEEDTFVADREYIVNIMVEADTAHKFVAGRKYVYINDRMCYEQLSSDLYVRGFETYFRTPKEIDQVNVTNLVKPVEGNTPDYWLDVDLEGVTIESVIWEVYNEESTGSKFSLMAEGDKFEDGKTYLMSVHMKNNTDKVFATKLNSAGEKMIATTVTLDGKRVVPSIGKNEEGDSDPYNYMWFYCWYDCESEQVSNAVVSIESPVAGKSPNYKVSIAGDEMSVYDVYWTMYTTDDSGSTKLAAIPSTHVFEKGKTYCAFIILKTNGNRKIPYNPTNGACGFSAVYNGERADTYAVTKLDGVEVDPYKYVELACWFDCESSVITSVAVSDIVAPVAGENPCYDRTVIGTGYSAIGTGSSWDGKQDVYRMKNGVIWYDVTNDAYDYVYENEEFIGGRTYEVWIYLETTDGNQFAVDGNYVTTVAGLVNGYDATVEAATGSQQNYLRMEYTFVCEKKVIYEIDIEIAEPVIGEAFSWEAIDSKYFYSNPSMDGENISMLNGVAWYIYGGDSFIMPNSGEKFKENTEYTVCIYGNLKEGYLIEDADTFVVCINGVRAFEAMIFTAEPATILVMYTFPKTDCYCSIVPVAEEAATCTVNGMKAHFACEKCGVMYKDANGEELLDQGEEEYVIWATDHNFGNWTEHEEYNNYHVGTCSNCGETIEAECEYTAVFVEGPSKYSKYNGTLFVCEVCGNEGAFYVDETSCEHIFGEWQENGRMGGTHYRVCECGKAYEEAECDYAITIEKAPSEYSDIRDVYLYTCKKCGNKHYTPIEGEPVTEDSITDEETNVTVSVPENSEAILPEGTTVSAKPVEVEKISEEAKEMMEGSLNGKVYLTSGYDIVLYYNEVVIQPNAFVSVTVPVGNAEPSDEMVVLHYDDYTVSEIESVTFNWEDGTVTFETDHFSKYLIARLEREVEYLYCYYPGEANGSPCSEYAIAGTEITLEECTFEALEGRQFKAWAIGSLSGEQKQPGEKITINAETYIYAIWEDVPENPGTSEAPNGSEDEGKPSKGCKGSMSGATACVGILAAACIFLKKRERKVR
ncbi:MAG: hypothetical protein IJV67_05490 [Clostridia bacterium]|nr:hypothetical protein [Clostridia bacterium]